MIGNFIPPAWRRPVPEELDIEPFRQEVRRGCLGLAVMAALRAEQYGYTLRQSLERQGLCVEQGTLYPLLQRLESHGFLVSEWRQEGRRQKRFYRLSPTGQRMLELMQREWRALASTMTSILKEPGAKAA